MRRERIAAGLLAIIAAAVAGAGPERVAVHIYDHATTGDPELRYAQAYAGEVFRSAGIAITWVNHSRTPDSQQSDHKPAVQPLPRDPTVILVRRASRVWGEAMGAALQGENGRPNTYAFVFVDQIERQKHACPAGLVIGYVLAHEIGHLFLGPESHSDSGIMRQWSGCTMADRNGGMLFSRQQASRMRADIAARMAVETRE